VGLSVDEIAGHADFHGAIRRQAQSMLQLYEANRRLSSVFATQQRWLMAHVGFALHFRRDKLDQRSGLHAARFFEVIGKHQVASRNTADAFLKEMQKYKFVRCLPEGRDKRRRPLEPTEASLEALFGWLLAHLATLDGLDGGERLQRFMAATDTIAAIQPRIADALLSTHAVRQPERTFSLFTWLNNGGIVMDWLISGMQDADADAERITTGVASIAEMAEWLKLSRTHLARKLAEAEALGSIGWQGRRGNSVMWVSKGFREEYTMAQAVKLAIIDEAFEASFGVRGAARSALERGRSPTLAPPLIRPSGTFSP
jgi:hypothetical protein